jgi:hypothetical protein
MLARGLGKFCLLILTSSNLFFTISLNPITKFGYCYCVEIAVLCCLRSLEQQYADQGCPKP